MVSCVSTITKGSTRSKVIQDRTNILDTEQKVGCDHVLLHPEFRVRYMDRATDEEPFAELQRSTTSGEERQHLFFYSRRVLKDPRRDKTCVVLVDGRRDMPGKLHRVITQNRSDGHRETPLVYLADPVDLSTDPKMQSLALKIQ
jgi:hypothetical protein